MVKSVVSINNGKVWVVKFQLQSLTFFLNMPNCLCSFRPVVHGILDMVILITIRLKPAGHREMVVHWNILLILARLPPHL